MGPLSGTKAPLLSLQERFVLLPTRTEEGDVRCITAVRGYEEA